MELEINTVHHLDNRIGLPMLPEKCCQLLIADPPYYKVKGDFDFKWKSFDEYLEFMEGQAKLYKRILADNGTLFLWGNSKKIAYVQVIFDKYFNLENSMVWRKIDSMQYQYYSVELSRCFNTHNERLLMYSNEEEILTYPISRGLEFKSKNPFSIYLREEFSKANVSAKTIAALFPSRTGGLTGCVSNWLNGDNVITDEQYNKIRDHLNGEYLKIDYTFLRKEYEELRQEYEQYRRYFNNESKLEEVLEFSQQSQISKNYDHETVKPEKLTRALILTCSRPNDLVVIPFAGSGTECAMSAKEGRRFIGFETTEKHVLMSNKRASIEMSKPDLFRTAI